MLIGVSILILFPIIATFLLSFVDWKFVVGLEQMQWVGFDNFKLIFSDQVFVKSLINNALFILSVPICMIFSLFLAVIIDQHVYLKSFFKVAFFMPYISSVVAVAVVWQVLFHPSAGPINQVLMSFGIENPPLWIADPNFALVRSEEHTSELQSRGHLVCRLLLDKRKGGHARVSKGDGNCYRLRVVCVVEG